MLQPYIRYSFFISVLVCCFAVNADTLTRKEAYKEVERQLAVWKEEGRKEDIKIIGTHKRSVVKQVKAGAIDLQAIVDEHNYKHKDGKFYGQDMPEREPVDASSVSLSSSSITTAKANNPVLTKRSTPKHATVPAANHPVAAYSYLDSRWSGFPATLIYEAKTAYVFPNGNAVYCANWDPRYLDPTPSSVGQQIKKCKVEKTKPKGSKAKKFKSGETIDINFGNVSGSSNDFALSTSASISGSTLRMTKSGEIAIGKFNAFSVASSGNGAGGGKRKRALVGRYTLDGHLITINTNNGDTHTGFIAWTSDSGSSKIDHVYINGEHFWNRKKGKKR